MADNGYVSLSNSGRYTLFNTYTYNIADANIIGDWRGAYTAILRANNIINSKVATSANVSQYRGKVMLSGHYAIGTWSDILQNHIQMILHHWEFLLY
jgi:hypothetical protein